MVIPSITASFMLIEVEDTEAWPCWSPVRLNCSGLDSYYDLISWGKKIIVSSQIRFVLLEYAFGEFAQRQIMTFGQSHTNKQLRQTIWCNYDYCFSGWIHNHLSGDRGIVGGILYPNINDFLSINTDRKQCIFATLWIHPNYNHDLT